MTALIPPYGISQTTRSQQTAQLQIDETYRSKLFPGDCFAGTCKWVPGNDQVRGDMEHTLTRYSLAALPTDREILVRIDEVSHILSAQRLKVVTTTYHAFANYKDDSKWAWIRFEKV